MRRYIHTTVKMTLSCLIAILVAEAIGLEYAITAGILAVLSTQLTKVDSFLMGGVRFLSALVGIFLSVLLFILLGFNVWVFMLFTAVFIALSFFVNLATGIVPTMVLVSHILLVGSFDWGIIINGILLMAIAILVSLIVNALYPMQAQKILSVHIERIDDLIRTDLTLLSKALDDLPFGKKVHKQHLDNKVTLENFLQDAELVDKDILFAKNHNYMAYLRMRHAQMLHIHRMFELSNLLAENYEHSHLLAGFINDLVSDIGKKDRATHQKGLLAELLAEYREKALPKTRREFETRAILYQMMFEIDGFLDDKIRFHSRYTMNH